MGDRKGSGPSQGSSGKYERWLPGASTGPVGIGYYNRPGYVDISIKLWAPVPYWEPNEFVVLTPLLFEIFQMQVVIRSEDRFARAFWRGVHLLV
ncbi:hypothetical protein PIB30_034303 [Stylosanthes scabra]|uniref:Uncharacterized protein n=1 Tax=Stylosanthes scabra TaxID=79078 RepID=A0ABU6QDF7_9FABA|nr:hypothetical protein [Stylosanthes scabra]